ncbi:MAG TPA: FHA domain-containing protein, partial [Candidatus Sericytochromatia bacterium]
GKVWQINGTRMRVGRSQENDLVIEKPEVSRKHAEIIVRDAFSSNQVQYQYFLRDQSSFGTFLLTGNGWQKVHHQEVILESGAKLKFGSTESQTMEFIINWK